MTCWRTLVFSYLPSSNILVLVLLSSAAFLRGGGHHPKVAGYSFLPKVTASTMTRSTTRRSGDLMGDQMADQIFNMTKM